jgi:hypothetical protein
VRRDDHGRGQRENRGGSRDDAAPRERRESRHEEARRDEEEALVLRAGAHERRQSQTPGSASVGPVDAVAERSPEKKEPEGKRDVRHPRREPAIERLEEREKRGGSERESAAGAAPPQPTEESREGRDLRQGEQKRHRVVVPSQEERSGSGIKERQAQRILGMRKTQRAPLEEARRYGAFRKDRLPLESPDREVVVRPHRLGQRAQRIERDADDENEDEDEEDAGSPTGIVGREVDPGAKPEKARGSDSDRRQEEEREPSRP